MGRPRKSPEQQVAAYWLYRKRFGPTAILRALETRFDDPASLRTVKKWVAGFKDNPQSVDDTFEWRRLSEFGLPWEAGAYLLAMEAFAHEGGQVPGYIAPRVDIAFGITVVSFRQAQWWWRVHLAAPALCLYDVYWIAQHFTAREMLHDVLGDRFDAQDVENFLAYSPWESGEALMRYHAAVRYRNVRPVQPIEQKQEGELNRVAYFAEVTQGDQPLVGVGGEFGLLPSQQLELLLRTRGYFMLGLSRRVSFGPSADTYGVAAKHLEPTFHPPGPLEPQKWNWEPMKTDEDIEKNAPVADTTKERPDG